MGVIKDFGIAFAIENVEKVYEVMGIISSKIIDAVKIPVFNRVLDVSSVRHKTVAGNVANVSTPGYKRKFVDFDAEMKKLLSKIPGLPLKTTDPKHLPGKNDPRAINIITDRDNTDFNSINNVDIDKEMGELAENQIIYNTAARLLARKFQGLKSAIRGS